ncbi:MAG: imidazole glycerol phosphate synthase subunit HisH [Candidatus Marinimicrobia bacterium]|nr:imidazole glycerol phosphate synthase subunit HisH [Candidatus Neomarinimicrobiota bacterium]|tara:strand:+ start:12441 stop:13085 length:645 start_codon:yes stop_codon:yes gene_type:complete
MVVLDYGIGNVRSMVRALSYLGDNPNLTSKPDEILSSSGVILPGVGSFPQGMKLLEDKGLDIVLKEASKNNIPILGICLGMQMLFEESEEFESTKGLSLIGGNIKRLDHGLRTKIKLPHVSWNEIKQIDQEWEGTILDGINEHQNMYFVHSYAPFPKDSSNVLAQTEYSGIEFCSVVRKGNIFGCQFHPEKSGKIGLGILKNFINICEERNEKK